MLGLLTGFILKPALISLACIAAVKNSQLQSANYRYFIISLSFALILLSLVLSALWPAWRFEMEFSASSIWLQGAWQLLQQPWLQALLFVYVLVALWLSIYNLMGCAYLLLRKCSSTNNQLLHQTLQQLQRKMGIKQPVRLVLADEHSVPCTWGVFKPVVQLPKSAVNWSLQSQQMILAHELAHIRNQDFARKLFAKQVVALFWFVPWLWWMLARSEDWAEQAADNRVLALGQNDADYAEVLLNASRGQLAQECAAMAINGHGDYYLRVMGVLDRYIDRSHSSTVEYPRLIAFGVAIVFLLATVSFSAKPLPQYIFQWPFAAEESKTVSPLKREEAKQTVPLTQNSITPAPIMRGGQANILDLPPRSKQREELQVIAKPLALVNAVDIDIESPQIQSSVTMSGYLPVHIAAPIYPRRALQRNIEAEIVASFSIDARGRTRNIHIVSGKHQALFAKSVKDAVAQFRFDPPTINGEKVQLDGVSETFSFKIERK